MIRLLALTFAATLAMLAISLQRSHAPSPALAAEAPAEHLNPWSKGAPPPARWQIVTTTAATTPTAYSAASEPATHNNFGPTVIPRDITGHFRISGTVNGQPSDFLVDTGADIVALTRDEAQRLGINVAPSDFHPILHTASGTGDAARITIARLTVAGSELHDVPAVVVDGLGTNLLGQSALRQLGKLEQDGDKMEIDPG